MKNLSHYTSLAEMFSFPSEAVTDHGSDWKKIIGSYDQALLPGIEKFISHVRDNTLAFRQEYFTATFDVQAVSSLDVGYILFGEDIRRSLFLINMKEEQDKAGNSCGTELPDHLANMLSLLPKLKEPEFAGELIVSLMIPAIKEMAARFGDSSNVYREILNILAAVMEADYPDSPYERYVITKKSQAARHETLIKEQDGIILH